MKKLITIVIVGILLYACKTDVKTEEVERDTYLISGEAPGVYNGIRAYLQTSDERGRKINMDTAIVMNERFQFEGKVDTPQLWNLSINSVAGDLALIVENKAISVKVDKDDMSNTTISGTKANDDLMSLNNDVKALRTKATALNNQIRNSTDAAEKSKLANEFTKLTREIRALPLNFAKNNTNSLYSLVVLDNLLKQKDADIENLSGIYEALDESIKSSKLGTNINSRIASIRKQRELTKATEIGQPAPDFTAPTPDGKQLNLKQSLGKVTIVDFWAAWCGPCRRENPNVVKIYNKYHDKGLEIIGVSLDGNSRQGDPKAAWLKAIEQDQLTWNQVSNLKYFSDPVARAYNIRSIPATFILDENGIIVAKNLRGAALETQIANMLN
ncbi:TlpA disulfide reductase family protein [uncultured Psychroserpens sp.]|uniref:TlpA disulfide reductase family protein n=1 Tax=uncultured Psychroserpens sp. TaxID=255436 RepID=UPI00261282A7|nr:TlpA disulfide reductase family protein [uncultured Psychroserpens sp.]